MSINEAEIPRCLIYLMRHVMWCGHMIIPRNATKHKSLCKESQEHEYRGQDLWGRKCYITIAVWELW